jgi:hypothetical protein
MVPSPASESVRTFLLGSDKYWSAKELATSFGSYPGDINVICKGLANNGDIAHYFVPFQLKVNGHTVDAKKYFYAKWSVKVPYSFHLVNAQFSYMMNSNNSQVQVNPADNPNAPMVLSEMAEKVAKTKEILAKLDSIPSYIPSTGKQESAPSIQSVPKLPKVEWTAKPPVVVHSSAQWKGTYAESTAYLYKKTSAVGHHKVPDEHIMEFFDHYKHHRFTMRILAAYFGCTIGHMSKVTHKLAKEHPEDVAVWVYKGMNTVGHPNTFAEWPIDFKTYKHKDDLKANLDSIFENLEKTFAPPQVQKKYSTSASLNQILPKIGNLLKADPLKKIGFEVEYAQAPPKPKPEIPTPGVPHFATNEVTEEAARDVWGLKPLSLIQECADLYVLTELSLDFPEIKEVFEAKRDFLADQFCNYLDMAIGGEFRHTISHCHNWKYLQDHKNLTVIKYLENGSLTMGGGDRPQAQMAWKKVRADMGIEALEQVYIIFSQGAWPGGGYGGKAWAIVTQTLIAYLKGEYSKMTFVDTVWGMQHNCDFVLNKAWSVHGLGAVLQYKQDGCIVDLSQLASPKVAALWKEKKGNG